MQSTGRLWQPQVGTQSPAVPARQLQVWSSNSSSRGGGADPRVTPLLGSERHPEQRFLGLALDLSSREPLLDKEPRSQGNGCFPLLRLLGTACHVHTCRQWPRRQSCLLFFPPRHTRLGPSYCVHGVKGNITVPLVQMVRKTIQDCFHRCPDKHNRKGIGLSPKYSRRLGTQEPTAEQGDEEMDRHLLKAGPGGPILGCGI